MFSFGIFMLEQKQKAQSFIINLIKSEIRQSFFLQLNLKWVSRESDYIGAHCDNLYRCKASHLVDSQQ